MTSIPKAYDFDNLNSDDCGKLQSEIMKIAHSISDGDLTAEAMSLAYEEVCKRYFPGISVDNIKRKIGQINHKKSIGAKRSARKINFTALSTYRKMAESFEVIPSDYFLAQFVGKTDSAWSTARSKLRKEGFDFQEISCEFGRGNAWRVILRPSVKEPVVEVPVAPQLQLPNQSIDYNKLAAAIVSAMSSAGEVRRSPKSS